MAIIAGSGTATACAPLLVVPAGELFGANLVLGALPVGSVTSADLGESALGAAD